MIHRLAFTIAALGAALVTVEAKAASATFVAPTTIGQGPLAALSTAGDANGYSVALNTRLTLLLAPPIGTQRTDEVSVFTLGPSAGSSRARVSFGVYNGGAPIIVRTIDVNGGNRVTVGNLFQRGCVAFGGCDYIDILTTRVTGGAAGVEVDYVSVNGAVLEVTAPTPGPGAWAMMLTGFGLTAWRAKANRKTRRTHAGSSFVTTV